MFQTIFSIFSDLVDIGLHWGQNLVWRPLFLLGKQGIKVRQMFLELPTAQAVTIYAGVLWVIPLSFLAPYASLYCEKLGFSDTELGVYQNMQLAASIVSLAVGGYLTDVWGPKRTLLFFDAVSWGSYALLLALATNKWWVIAAILLFSTNAGSTPPYQCLMMEGIQQKRRAIVYTVLQMANLAPAILFFPLVGGMWVEKRGLLRANHEMYWLLLAFITLGMWCRWKFLPSSKKGGESSPAALWQAVRDGARQYLAAMKEYFGRPGSRIILASKFIDEWIIAQWGIYSSIYFVKSLDLKESYLSVFSQVSSYVGFFTLFIIIPSIPPKSMMKILGFDQILGLVSFGILLVLGKGGGNVLLGGLVSSGFGAAAVVLYWTVSMAAWMTVIDEKTRAKVYSASWCLIRVGIAVTGSAAAFLYGKVSPMALLWVMIGLRIVGFVLLRRASRILTASTA